MRIVARNIILYYRVFNKELKINTDARKLQFGAVIIQEGKLIAFIVEN